MERGFNGGASRAVLGVVTMERGFSGGASRAVLLEKLAEQCGRALLAGWSFPQAMIETLDHLGVIAAVREEQLRASGARRGDDGTGR